MSKIHVLRRGEGGVGEGSSCGSARPVLSRAWGTLSKSSLRRRVAGLALVGEVVPRIVRAAREYQLILHTLLGLRPLKLNRVVATGGAVLAPKLVKAFVRVGPIVIAVDGSVVVAGAAEGGIFPTKRASDCVIISFPVIIPSARTSSRNTSFNSVVLFPRSRYADEAHTNIVFKATQELLHLRWAR